ncbi:hypothetical protein [Olleya aquimaris]|uniref:Lipoprotein n=1 Tax=Olleya aquimaris TaxID=639310 RepID=A0A327RFN2_9FLAO|nr:hypothetical protein [Olleya aquimaris]RAJ15038.1 hypothetical protein LY08_01387 [Olleya aquimaris]
MKIKILFTGIAFVIFSCGSSTEEDAAKRFCECAGDFTTEITKIRENSGEMNRESYNKALTEFKECADPGGELKKMEDAMSPEERKAYAERMQTLVKANCPDIVEAMGMDK